MRNETIGAHAGGFLYDPHTHTAEVSSCGRLPARELVERYQAKGFSGIVVTDHLYGGYLRSLPCEGDWQACMDDYLTGYRTAKAAGDRIGLEVLLGAELRFPESQRDFLVYGIDEAFLRAHPYLCEMSHEAFARKFHGQILMVHAHPFRSEYACGADWPLLDGAEVYNANVRHENRNEKTEALCKRTPHLLQTAGSDTHRAGDEGRAGLRLYTRVQDSAAFAAALRGGAYEIYRREPEN